MREGYPSALRSDCIPESCGFDLLSSKAFWGSVLDSPDIVFQRIQMRGAEEPNVKNPSYSLVNHMQ